MKNARFVITVVSAKDYPGLKDDRGNFFPEIAVAGRSNVGKSSLLNHIFQKKNLARTSSRPGKTQALNFFAADQKVFVDLPGYGYADVPLSIRKEWGSLVEGYLTNRPNLKLILFLFDIRRTPGEEDLQLMEWVAYHRVPVILVLTKTDKVNQKEKAANTTKILEIFESGVTYQSSDKLRYLHYSVLKNRGRDQLLAMIRESL